MPRPERPAGRTVSGVRRPLALAALFWLAYLAILFLASVPKGFVPPAWGQLVWGTLSSCALLLLSLAFLRFERCQAADVGLGREAIRPWPFALGVLVGFAVYGSMLLAAMLVAGPIRFVPVPWHMRSILLTVVTFLALSTMEELGFRGYTLRRLVPVIGSMQAQALVAVAFASTHILFGWPWQAVLFGVLPNAFLFGAAALASRGLAMPIGLHAALNVTRWAVGEKGAPGLWRMTMDDRAADTLASFAPTVGVLLTLLGAFALSRWRVTR